MMLRVLLLLALCLPAGAAEKAFPYHYDLHEFPNGLRLVTVPTEFPNVVALYIVVRTGSRNEVEPGHTGFAHLFEHMMFRGTKRFPPDRYEQVLKETGASSNAYTSDDRTVYHTTFSKEDLGTILDMEADRFQNLAYSPEDFKTETLAVLGEYNKNSAAPTNKLEEVLRDTAFDRHTYKHTTMGFERDIRNMPTMYDYSRRFFDHYYRPEYTTMIVVGDVTADNTRALVEKYWGGWKRGDFQAQIPVEPPQQGPRTNQIKWPSPTLPWVWVAFHGPAYSDTAKDQTTLDVINFLGFSENSPLYTKLVINEQKVDVLEADNADHKDPELFLVVARVKKQEDVDYVRDQILATLAEFRDKPVEAKRLSDVKSNLRYRFALGLDNSEAIADTLAHFLSLADTPETINKVYDLYDAVTPADIQAMARKYFADNGRTIVTLSGGAR